MATPISGKNGSVNLGSSVEHVVDWSITDTVAGDKFSSSSTAGYTTTIPGAGSWSGSFKTKHDGAAEIAPGTEITNAIFALDNTNTNRFVGNIVILECKTGSIMDQGAPVPVFEYTFDGQGPPSARPS